MIPLNSNTPPLVSWVVESEYLAFLDKDEKNRWSYVQVAHVKYPSWKLQKAGKLAAALAKFKK